MYLLTKKQANGRKTLTSLCWCCVGIWSLQISRLKYFFIIIIIITLFCLFLPFFLFLFIFMVTCTSQSTMLFLGDLYFMIILAFLKKKNLFICLYALLFVIRTVFYSNSGSSKKLFVGTLPMRLLTPTKNHFLCELTKLSNTVICSLHCLSQW